jgi:hypothetical protein
LLERIAGALHRAGAEVDPRAVVLNETDAAVFAGEFAVAGARPEIFGKRRGVGLEAGRVDVGDDVDLVARRHLSRQADEKRILHR